MQSQIQIQKFTSNELVEKCHQALPERIRTYLNQRCIPDEIIKKFKIGWNGSAITIPIYNRQGEFLFFKYRRDPEEQGDKAKYWYDPDTSAELYGWENINEHFVVLCEGEFDRLVLESKGIPAITSTSGAGTFKDEWIKDLEKIPNLYICYDNDDIGKDSSQKIAEKLPRVKIVSLPKEDDIKDVTDFIKLKGIDEFRVLIKRAKTLEEFRFEFKTYEIALKKLIFPILSLQELTNILDLTIKQDRINKIITFLCQVSAYTENSQFNISFNAPSSTGKSYIPIAISSLFPREDVIKVGYCSPTAFFHDKAEFRREQKDFFVDLERKILIFLDQPHTLLLEHLRPLLSHDEKEINIKITDKSQKLGLRTKNVVIRGHSSVIFCSAGLKIDEQEATRFLLLSPETSQEKIKLGIEEVLKKEADLETYLNELNNHPERKNLIERIKAIKEEHIQGIKIHNLGKIQHGFLSRYKLLKPRHQRDIKRLISIIKSLTLLNLWYRERRGVNVILTTDQDIEEGFRIWEEISFSQELNLPPYIYRIFEEIIISLHKRNQKKLTRSEILQEHSRKYGRPLAEWQLRREIIPMLEMAGLITQEQDPDDKRNRLIIPVYPTTQSTLFLEENNCDSMVG
jgi:DNA primase